MQYHLFLSGRNIGERFIVFNGKLFYFEVIVIQMLRVL